MVCKDKGLMISLRVVIRLAVVEASTLQPVGIQSQVGAPQISGNYGIFYLIWAWESNDRPKRLYPSNLRLRDLVMAEWDQLYILGMGTLESTGVWPCAFLMFLSLLDSSYCDFHDKFSHRSCSFVLFLFFCSLSWDFYSISVLLEQKALMWFGKG